METIGERFKKLRLSRGKTIKELMEILKINSSSAISRWENGKTTPKQKTLLKYADYFNVSVDWLLYGDMDVYVRDILSKNGLSLNVIEEQEFIQMLSKDFSERYPNELEILGAYQVFKERSSITFSLEQLFSVLTDIDQGLLIKMNDYLDEHIFPLRMFPSLNEQEEAKRPYISTLQNILDEMRQTRRDTKALLDDLIIQEQKASIIKQVEQSKNQE